MDSNDRKLLRLYARSRLQGLLDEGISPRLADRARGRKPKPWKP
ncbi:MAG: hypothetical protein QXI39_09675 [Candidatus Bathyarchaeia archaeon]